MKSIILEVREVYRAEKDAKLNKLGMQFKAWKFNNDTTLLVRLYKHEKEATKALWENRTNGEVEKFVLSIMYVLAVIHHEDSWEYSVDMANQCKEQDEFEDKNQCIYFAWTVKKDQLRF